CLSSAGTACGPSHSLPRFRPRAWRGRPPPSADPIESKYQATVRATRTLHCFRGLATLRASVRALTDADLDRANFTHPDGRRTGRASAARATPERRGDSGSRAVRLLAR